VPSYREKVSSREPFDVYTDETILGQGGTAPKARRRVFSLYLKRYVGAMMVTQ